MKKIKIAACLMALVFLFTGCKKKEIEGGFYETKLELTYLMEYPGASDGTTFHPFDELDCELYIQSYQNNVKFGNTSKLKIYDKYINEEDEICKWSKDDSPAVLSDWEYSYLSIGLSSCYIKYAVIEITQDGKKYYGWMRVHSDNLEIVVSKTPNHILAMGCKD